MIPQQLIDYILQSQNAGYDINTIRTYLINNGWNAHLVDQAISSIKGRNDHHTTIHISNTTLMGVGALILIVGFSFILVNYFLSDDDPEPKYLLDYNIEMVTETIQPGDKLLFTNIVANMGDVQRYDVFLDYQIIQEFDGELVARWNETKDISGLSSYAVSKKVDAPPGRYKIYGVVTYAADAKAQSSAQFIIESDDITPTCTDGLMNQDETDIDCGGVCAACPSCNDGLMNQDETDIDCGGVCTPCLSDDCKDCNDLDPCTEDLCIGENCTYRPVTPCCGNGICEADENNTCNRDCSETELTASEIINMAEKLAVENHVKAAAYCEDISDVKKKDICFQTVSIISGKPDVCALIVTSSTRDLCYMKHIRDKQDYTFCDNLNNKNLKEACINMRELKGAE